MKKIIIFLIFVLIFFLFVACDVKDISDDISKLYDEELIAKICESDPCSKVPNSNGECSSKDKINYSCGCKENYSWDGADCVADTRTSPCKGLPDNASWNTVSSITQTWSGTEWLPSEYAVYNEVESSTHCYFKCNQNYKWNGTLCVADTRSVECTAIPENADWNTVSEITQTWSGTDWQPSEKSSYNTDPSSSECRFKCIDGYFWNADQNLCVDPCESAPCVGIEHSTEQCIGKAANKYVCECETGFAWNGSKCLNPCDPNPCLNVENSTGECTKIDNFTQYSCGCNLNYSWNGSLCDADTRNADCIGLPNNAEWNTVSSITQTWSGSEWLPTTSGVFSKIPSETECRYKCKINYTWNESTLKCDADTRDANCTSKSANSVWNDNGANGKFTQTWDVSEWKPGSFQSTCSESAGTCHFKCNESYHCENNQCVFNAKTADCTGLPGGATWNTASSINQEWDGSEWVPTAIGSYDTTPSTEECKFKCKTHYTWDNTTCKADSQDSPCTGRPENAEWNSVSTITQTWNGSSWQPTTTGSYNTTASTQECRFKCVEDYFWNGSKCVDPCDPNPCEEIEHSTEVCNGESANEYSCECENAFEWNGTRCRKIGMPCTGQTKCYSNLAEISCPASGAVFFGQDAQYAAGGMCLARSFTIDSSHSGQKIVIDNNTDLEWAQLIPTSKYTWANAKTYCENSGYGGYNDWRLPSPKELLSIVDNGRVAPAVDSSFFPNHSNDKFWTSMKDVQNYGKAWFVDFDSGYAERTKISETYYVSCVRGGSETNDFVKSVECSENIVTDKETGLFWTTTYVERTWKDALNYCENLSYACYSDWRLPNKNELVSLLDHEENDPATIFPNMPVENFWTSTSFADNVNRAWYVGFSYGNVYNSLKSNTLKVRCVR